MSHTKFSRIFDPEFLQARKDITPLMLNTALGDIKAVTKHLKDKDNELDLYVRNRDGNSLLLLAVANKHLELTKLLLELKADVTHKNCMNMDALDYAAMDNIRNPIGEAVLRKCDYIIPDIFDGPYFVKSDRAVELLRLQNERDQNAVCARTSLIGRTPDFSDIFSKPSEYRTDWINSLKFMGDCVRKGVLLLNDELGYLERDAMLSGLMEMPYQMRYVYRLDAQNISKFSAVLHHVYGPSMDRRIFEATNNKDAVAVASLLKAKANAQAQDIRGQTVLMRAAYTGEPMVAKALVMAKANVNTITKEGYSALFLAAVRNHESVTRLLVRSGADMNQRSFKGTSVFDFVKHERKLKILRILQEEKEKRRQGSA